MRNSLKITPKPSASDNESPKKLGAYAGLNLLCSTLPVLLMYLSVMMPNKFGNLAFDQTAPGKYYIGDSYNSVHYNITRSEQQVLDNLWTGGATEHVMKTWFQQLRKRNDSAVVEVRCGMRWEYKKAEMGGYCYDQQRDLIFQYATPPLITYLSSHIGSQPLLSRVVLIQHSGHVQNATVRIAINKYRVIPTSQFEIVTNRADLPTTASCQFGTEIRHLVVGAWGVFDEDIDSNSVNSSSFSSLIRYRIQSGGQVEFLGSLFSLISKYTSVAAYCDIQLKDRTLVGWGGFYISNAQKSSGFIVSYSPLLLMYLMYITFSGHAFGRDMLKGYYTFCRTGAATYTAVQVCLFNERIYYVIFNAFGSKDFNHACKIFKYELAFLTLASLIFHAFCVTIITCRAVGNLYTKCENFMWTITFVLTTLFFCGLVVFADKIEQTGLNRSCETGIAVCFYQYNSTALFFATYGIAFLCQFVCITLYRTSLENSKSAEKNIRVTRGYNFNGVRTTFSTYKPQNCFEQYCMNGGIVKNNYDMDIYCSKSGKLYTRSEFIRFKGFTQIEGVGIIRTKDIWIVYGAFLIPASIRSRISISLIIWQTPSPNKVLAPVRMFWEHIQINHIMALQVDVG